MRTFRDVPHWYEERLRKTYRKNTDKILRCPNVYKTNHLIQGCVVCNSVGRYKGEDFVPYIYDRVYLMPNNPYLRFCIRAFVDRNRYIYTSVEFPTPKITSQNITRIPQFYDPLANLIYDCFVDEEDLDKNSNPYFINKAHRVCSEYGLHYCQVLINKKTFSVVHQQPIAKVDDAAYKSLVKSQN